MRMLIVGAGAVGGYFGGRLLQAGRNVTFLLREGRATQIRERGLQLVSPRGDASLQPAVVSAGQLRARSEPYDLILVSTKSHSLPAAIHDFAPAVGPSSLVLPLLNGMQHLDLLCDRFGTSRVLGGTVRIMADMLPNGTIWQHTSLNQLTFGFLSASAKSAERSAEVHSALSVFGFSTDSSSNVVEAMWQKWWLLAAIGAVCVLADGSLGEARRAIGGEQFNYAVLEECMSIATANGYPPRAALVKEMRAMFADPTSSVTSSLFRDMKRGVEVEADQIIGDLIRRAGKTDVPMLRAANVRLQVYEVQRLGIRTSAQTSTSGSAEG